MKAQLCHFYYSCTPTTGLQAFSPLVAANPRLRTQISDGAGRRIFGKGCSDLKAVSGAKSQAQLDAVTVQCLIMPLRSLVPFSENLPPDCAVSLLCESGAAASHPFATLCTTFSDSVCRARGTNARSRSPSGNDPRFSRHETEKSRRCKPCLYEEHVPLTPKKDSELAACKDLGSSPLARTRNFHD